MHKHFPAFRNYREYAGGGLADMGAHHFDIAQWALDMDNSGPVKIEPPSGEETTGLKFTYADGVEMFHGGPSGCTFEGELGTIYVDRGKLESTPEAIVKTPLAKTLPRAWSTPRSRPQLARRDQEPAEADLRRRDRPSLGQRSATWPTWAINCAARSPGIRPPNDLPTTTRPTRCSIASRATRGRSRHS